MTGSGPAREKTYQNVEKLVRGSRGDWKIRSNSSISSFFLQDEDSPVVYVSGRSMSLNVYPPLNYR